MEQDTAVKKTNSDGWNVVRTIAIVRAISILGDELAIFALLLREKHNGGGAFAIAAIMAAGQLPLIFLAPLAGVVADRVPIRRLAPIVGALQAGFAALLVVKAPLWISLVLIALIGAGQAFTAPSWSATLPEIAGKDFMPRAMSLIQALYSLAALGGPAVAGIMVSQLGYVTPLIFDALTFALLALVPTFLTLPRHAREISRRTKGDLWSGLQIVRDDPAIRALAILGFSLNVTLGVFNVAELFFALNNLHASTFIYGIVGSTFAVGMLAGALVNKRRDVGPAQVSTNAIVGIWLVSFGIILTAFSWHWVFLIPTAALAGVGASTANAFFGALMLQIAPENSRGRVVAAVQGLSSAGQIISLALGGVIVSVIDPRYAILISGIACLVALVLFSPGVKRTANQ